MSTVAQTRAAQLKLLSDRANTIAALLSVVHILSDDTQQSALLDCSSIADDFAKDFDQFVATRTAA